ncbi:Nuclear matrix constituent protein-related, putative isoform 6 [Hibiscus syriacus]|uniref:Nuclear matrix constituent protein-related, putative isoform 6 n=1 Tax=Hibiscus syriacus TaxID=106335 RepID=A0A6A2WFQ4_HIBSY|nr:Nuclear matrix constituent protein-related, putative isoform 6 [Hibiscus syriacus]
MPFSIAFISANGGGPGPTASEKDPRILLSESLKIPMFNIDDCAPWKLGLLLIEKKEWTSKCEELKQELAEFEEILRREQAANMIALSEVEKREENLTKALAAEKQCVLEKALRDIQEEHVQVKLSSDTKLANANALISGIEGKSLEVEKKLRDADSRLAEANRKSSELEMKLQEIEARESVLQREHLSLVAEGRKRQMRVKAFSSRKRRALKSCKNIDLSTLKLKEMEDDIGKRFADLVSKEKEVESMRSTLEAKGKDLVALEEMLTARERVEIQKLIDEQRVILDSKMQEFELELEEKRKSVDEELESKIHEVKQQEAEVNHKKKIGKQKLYTTRENLQALKDEIDKIGSETSQQELRIREESLKLKITEQERAEHIRLQSELKLQIVNCRCQEELLLKEHEDLKQQMENLRNSGMFWMKKELKSLCCKSKLTKTRKKDLQERIDTFEEVKERELASLRCSKEDAGREGEELKSARRAVEREKNEVVVNRDKLKEQQLEMQKDIDQLGILSSRLKDQRQLFIRERHSFLNLEIPLPRLADETLSCHQGGSGVTNIKRSPEVDAAYPESAGRISWLRKCTKIFNISPTKRNESKDDGPSMLTAAEAGAGIQEEPGELCLGIPGDSIHNQLLQPNTARELGDESVPSADQSFSESKVQEIPEDSLQSEQKSDHRNHRKPRRKPKSGLGRTRSVKAVVEDAKLFLGKFPEGPEPSTRVQPHETSHISEESAGVSSHTAKGARARSNARKRQLPQNSKVSELNAADSEGHSESVTAGGRRKRQQTVAPGLPTPGENRYNFRRSRDLNTMVHAKINMKDNKNPPQHRSTVTVTATAIAAQASSDVSKTRKEPDEGGLEGEADTENRRNRKEPDDGSLEGEVDTGNRRSNLAQVTALKRVEILESKAIKIKTSVDVDNDTAAKSVENVDLIEKVNVTAENGDEDESGDKINEDDEEYEDDDEIEHPGDVSIGKKIWTFFTS